MTNILAIETATSSCSVALRLNDEVVVRSVVGNNIHSQVLLSMVDDLLAEASLSPNELNAVAVGQGPGSFTGLRIGVGVGQGLAYGADCSMIGVSSLDALALQSKNDGVIIAGTDARMGEIFWCEYFKHGTQISRMSELSVSAPNAVNISDSTQTASLVGNAWAEYWPDLSADFLESVEHQSEIIHPCAGALLMLAEEKYTKEELISPINFAPIYVRDDVAKKSTKALF